MELQTFKQNFFPILPANAGIYKFIDEANKVLYVGKAKNIKNRVTSYFANSNQHSSRIKLLIRKVARIEFTIVETEHDALLLENSLIKKHQPKYNINLKDNKTYPFICITNERFPRIFLTRTRVKDGSEYLGPYTSVHKVRSLLDFIKSLYPIRICNYNLSQSNIDKQKFKVCLEYHIGNCLGPCEGLQNEEDYNKSIDHIKEILKGRTTNVIQILKMQMIEYAEAFQFEKANLIKTKLNILENYQAKSTIVNPSIDNVDVFSIEHTQHSAFVSYFKISNGTIIQTHATKIANIEDESTEDILLHGIINIRRKYGSLAKEIITSRHISFPDESIKITIPARGDKKKLLDLAHANAVQFKNQTLSKLDRLKEKKGSHRVLEQLRVDFNMSKVPTHIECFDNSNIQGAFPVASLVVFKDGKPSKKDYRHFNIKSVEGPNDFASMEEVVLRRYKRCVDENEPLPQLVLIDGGKGQLSAALKSIEIVGIKDQITLASIAKKLEEIYFPGDPYPLHLNKKSESLRLLQNIRNEAHRFAINFHRDRRSKKTVTTELLQIKGIGEKTTDKLLRAFRSTKKIMEADSAEIEKIVGKNAARIVMEYFQNSNK